MIMTVEIRYTVKCNQHFLRALGYRLRGEMRKDRKATRGEVKAHYKIHGFSRDNEMLHTYEERP